MSDHLFLLVYSIDGLLVLALLIICTCAYITKVPRLKTFFLSEKKGFFGVFYKGNCFFELYYNGQDLLFISNRSYSVIDCYCSRVLAFLTMYKYHVSLNWLICL